MGATQDKNVPKQDKYVPKQDKYVPKQDKNVPKQDKNVQTRVDMTSVMASPICTLGAATPGTV